MPFPRTWPEDQANEYSILRAAATSQAPPPSRNWVAMYNENRGPSRPFLDGLDQILCNRGWFWVNLAMGVTAAHPDIARPLWPLCRPDPRLLYEPGRGIMDVEGRCISPEPGTIIRTTASPDPQGEMLQRKTLDELITDLKAAESELQTVRAARLPPPPPRLLEALAFLKRSLAASALNFVAEPDPLLEAPAERATFFEFSSSPSLEEQRALFNSYMGPAAEKINRQIEKNLLALEKSALTGEPMLQPQKKKHEEPKAPALDPFARTPRRFLKRDEK